MQTADGNWQDKGATHLTLDMLREHADGLHLILMPPDDHATTLHQLARLLPVLPQMRHIAARYLYRGDDRARINRLDRLARQHGLMLLATNDPATTAAATAANPMEARIQCASCS